MRILILNGPNLNLIGKREPEIYGKQSFEVYFDALVDRFNNHHLIYFQSNSEGELIDRLHQADEDEDVVIFNPGAYSHTSIALADAIRSISIPVIEVHISNIHAREEYRKHSFTAAASAGCVSGFGLEGYSMAIEYAIRKSRIDANQ